MYRQKLILVAGPTASGKSARALELARSTRGTIINADAMQLYAGLPILTNQPDPTAQKEIPHTLYGTVDPGQRSSAGKWRTLAVTAIEKTVAENRTPILVGGTGLYFRALIEGLAEIPDVPAEVRAAAQALYDKLGEENFRLELAKLDPASAARFAKNDRQRLVRAYEVTAHTGKSLSEWQKQTPAIALPDDLTIEAHRLMLPREELYAACDKRFAQMITHGAVEEVRAFMKRDLDPDLPVMKTIGVTEIGAHLKGEITLEQAIAKAQQATRNYAKRQMTWFRNQWPF